MFFFTKSKKKATRPAPAPRARLGLEQLESREVPYAVSGNAWLHPEMVTIGIVPDGTIVGSNDDGYITSNLQSTFDNHSNSTFRTTWRAEIYKAAQVWAQQSNLNFTIIADNGGEIGSGDYQQGDPLMADIRIGGYAFGSSTLAQAFAPPPVNNYSIAGDIQFNTSIPGSFNWNVGTKYDLFTVASHEFGHSLGLYHSNLLTATMYGSYTTTKAALNADDILGIQAVYGGARTQDSFDAVASNGTFAAASDLTSTINTTTKQALVTGLDRTTTVDLDYYRFTAPVGTDGTLSLKMQSSGLSLLSGKVTVYAANQTTVLGSATALGDYDGSTLTVSVAGIAAGSTYYVKVEGAETATGSWQAFNTGQYALSLGFAGTAAPDVPLPNTQELNGNPIQGGGGQAVKFTEEMRVNATTSGSQKTAETNRHAVGVDASGNSMVVWHSDGQDGSGTGIYAQRYNNTGAKVGGEFRVNTTTANAQENAVVAMNGSGWSVVAWASSSQDGSGWGIYAQRYDNNGNKVGSEFRVNTTTANAQITPTVAINDLGNFVVSWASYGQDGSGYGVYAQRYDEFGNKVGSEFRVNTTTAGDQLRPAIALDEASNILVSWTSDGQDGSSYGIYARGYTWTLSNRLAESRVNTTTSDIQDYSSVAISYRGDAVITWSSKYQDGDGWGVYARRLGTNAQFSGGEFLVNSTTAGDQDYSAVAMDNEGNFLITWSAASATLYDVYAQQFTSAGAMQGTEFRVNTTTSGDQDLASVAISSYGNAVVVWSGTGTGDSSGIFAQMYKVNAGSGLSNMEAGEPHGYGEEGCGCGHDGGLDHDHDHAHDDGPGAVQGNGCGCLSCYVAAVTGQPTPAVRPVRFAPVALNPGLALLGEGATNLVLPAFASPARPFTASDKWRAPDNAASLPQTVSDAQDDEVRGGSRAEDEGEEDNWVEMTANGLDWDFPE